MNRKELKFGEAIELLKQGKKIARKGWNGKGMFAYYVKENSYPTQSGVAIEVFPSGMVPYNAYIALKTANGTVSTWAPSTSDTLAEDWMVVEVETFKDRLNAEFDELNQKIEKLKYALKLKTVPETELDILSAQLEAMEKYSRILGKRILKISIHE